MTEEPYRWLEAMGHRREYVVDQLKAGSPVFAASLREGILLLGVGTGRSKVFELFDRHALAGLGHPADLERIRQAAIDAAHLEAFNRAPEDVSLRRLISFGLSPQLKTHFEQVLSAPYLIELILVELGGEVSADTLARLHFDGGYDLRLGGVMVAAQEASVERAVSEWLVSGYSADASVAETADRFLQAWWCVMEKRDLGAGGPTAAERSAGWRAALSGRVVEMAWLERTSDRAARYEARTLGQIGL